MEGRQPIISTEKEILKPGHKSHPNFLAYYHYLNKFKDSNNDEYFIRFTVNEEKAKNKNGRNIIHSAFVSDIDIYKKDKASVMNVSGIINPGEQYKTPTDKKLRQLLENVNSDISKDNILFQGGDPTLYGVHNLSEDSLKHVFKMGGLANPSLAVVDKEVQVHSNFGDISLVAYNSLIEKKTGNNAGTYGADVYSPRYPRANRFLTDKGYNTVEELFNGVEDYGAKSMTTGNFWRVVNPKLLHRWHVRLVRQGPLMLLVKK